MEALQAENAKLKIELVQAQEKIDELKKDIREYKANEKALVQRLANETSRQPLDSQLMCPACNVPESRNTIIKSCGHIVCEQCTKAESGICPLCAKPIEATGRAYF